MGKANNMLNIINTTDALKSIPPYPIQLGAIKGFKVDTILDVNTSALIICSSRIPRLIKAKYAQNFCATSFDDIIDTTLPGAITDEIAEMIRMVVNEDFKNKYLTAIENYNKMTDTEF